MPLSIFQAIKIAEEREDERHGFCLLDGYEQAVSNYRIDPPGLFRGIGDHPKMGMIKKRIEPEEVTINIGR